MEKIGLTNLKWFWLHNLRSWMHFRRRDRQHCLLPDLREHFRHFRTLLAATSADDSKTRGWVEVDDSSKLRSVSHDCNTLPTAPVLFAARWETAALAAPGAALAAAGLERRGRWDVVACPRALDGSRTPSWNFSRRPRLGFFSFGNVLCFRDDTFGNGWL